MIYRLHQGMRHELKKWLAPFLILVITMGFPAIAALVNREDLTLGPTPFSQKDDPGVVLGNSTDTPAVTTEPTTDTGTATSSNTAPQPTGSTSRATTGAKSSSSSQSTLPFIQPTPQPEGGQGGGDNSGDCICSQIPNPTEETPTIPEPVISPPTQQTPLLNVETEALGVGVDASVTVTP